jgi:ABC-type Fe3+ transport system permease subunit
MIAGVAIGLAMELLDFAFRQPAPLEMLGLMLQIGLGLAAAVGLQRALGRWSILGALVLAGVALATAHRLEIERRWVRDLLQWTPLFTLLAAGAASAIPRPLYEAAAVDRASAWFILGNVTMPLIAPLLLCGIVFRAAAALDGHRAPQGTLLAYAVLVGGIAIGELLVLTRSALERGRHHD